MCLLPIESGRGFEWIESDIHTISEEIIDLIESGKTDEIDQILNEKEEPQIDMEFHKMIE